MPLPSPNKGEKREDWNSRCMGNTAMNGEFPDADQRMAVCGQKWRDKNKKKNNARDDDKLETYSVDMEIFAVGRWNGFDFAIEDLMDFAAAFAKLKEVHKVPLKFGHNGEQKMTDGQPALGWITDVWVDRQRGKLMARAEKVPEIVFKAIEAERYKHVSIEADFGVEYKGEHFANVLSGVALLGADIPAVNTLEDLRHYMGRDTVSYSAERHGTFTAVNVTEELDMATEAELKAQIAALEETVASQAKEQAKFAREKAELEAKQKELTEQEEQRKKDAAKAEFERKQTDLTGELDELVKQNKCTPAQRDKLVKDMTEEQIDSVAFSVNVLKEAAPMSGLDEDQQGKGKNGDSGKGDYTDPTEEINKRAMDFSRQNNVSLMDATEAVMQANPKLAREYVDITGDGRE